MCEGQTEEGERKREALILKAALFLEEGSVGWSHTAQPGLTCPWGGGSHASSTFPPLQEHSPCCRCLHCPPGLLPAPDYRADHPPSPAATGASFCLHPALCSPRLREWRGHGTRARGRAPGQGSEHSHRLHPSQICAAAGRVPA